MVCCEVIIFFLFYAQCIAADPTDLAPWLNELSAQNLADLVNVSDASYKRNPSQDYRHIDPKAILREEKDPTEENQQVYKDMDYIMHVASKGSIPKACYTIQSTWRRARLDLIRYFSLREHYDNTHTFEIGYLTHVIVSKYMNVLELYEMIDERFIKLPTKIYAPLSWMWYIYTNIVDYTRHIIQWCTMMHEIKTKYGLESGTTKAGVDYESMSTLDPEEMDIDKYAKHIHKNYLEQVAAKKKKQLEWRLHYKYGMRNPSMNLTTAKTRRPPQFWKWRQGAAGAGKDYGWSVEKFFDDNNDY